MTTTFDFDIQPSKKQDFGKILPGGEVDVKFSIRNSGNYLKRAEVILEPVKVMYKSEKALSEENGLKEQASEPEQKSLMDERLKELASWLQLDRPPESDYQPQTHLHYTVKIKVPEGVKIGTYTFRLLVVGHDDPDNEYQQSEEVSFEVVARRVKVLPFVIGGIVLLALLAIGASISLHFLKPSPGLVINLKAIESKVTVGQPVEYQLKLENTFKDTEAENLVMEYIYPEGILGAWVEWKAENEDWTTSPGISACGSTEAMLRCRFEKIESQQAVDLKIYVLPGPLYPNRDMTISTMSAEASSPTSTPTAQTVQIDNTGRFTLRWIENGEYQENLDLAANDPFITLTPIDEKKNPVSGAAIPAVDIAPVGLPAKITLVGWNNAERGKPIFLKYELPQGMRFANYPDDKCEQQTGIYDILHCAAESEVPIDIQVIPLQPSVGFVQILRGKEEETAEYKDLQTEENVPRLSSAINQIEFNGSDEWAQLGYSGLPDTKEFAVEMWVNPYSLEDGQALIGTHRHSPDVWTVSNQFLVGYYNGSINVNVFGECRNLDLLKTAEPFHLAVVVKGYLNNNKRDVTVFKDGELVETMIVPCCPDCKVELWENPKDDEVNLNWIIGQDWDANGSDLFPSDFFHGAISDVRIYAGALTSGQVQEDMYLPPLLCETGEECAWPDLIGWWPLSQPSQSASGEQSECILPMIGTLDKTATDAPCVLIDLGPNHLNGALSGGAWENKNAGFGDALAFNGSSALYLNSMLLSDFTEGTSTIEKETNNKKTSPTPTPSITSFDINAVSLNGQSNTVSVAPGASVIVKYDYLVRGINGCPGCIIELVTGLESPDSHSNKCAYFGIPGVSPGRTGSENAELTAPDQPGTYDVVVAYLAEYTCDDALSKYGSTEITNKQTIGEITVIEPTMTPTNSVPLIATETALKATQTALAATQTAMVTTTGVAIPTLITTPEVNIKSSEPTGVPVTMAAWIYVEAVPSQQQTILAASFTPDNWNGVFILEDSIFGLLKNIFPQDFLKNICSNPDDITRYNVKCIQEKLKARITLGIDENGHVQAIYQNNEGDYWVVTDEKRIPAGRWIHYAVMFWFDKQSGELEEEYLLLFRDGQKVKASPQKTETNQDINIPAGLYLGGIGDINCNAECFTGRIDEVRIWNRALYKPIDNESHISTDIDFWRRLPGVAFDEVVYWSFDNHIGNQANGLCQNKACDQMNLTISGPAWVPNALSIDYTDE